MSSNGHMLAFVAGSQGETAATPPGGGNVQLWDLRTRTLITRIGAPLTGHSGPPTALFFSPDTKTLTTGDTDATVRRWNIAMPADLAQIACSIAGRPLNRAEWAHYVPPGIDYRDICPSLRGLR